DEYVHESGNATGFTTLFPKWLIIGAFQGILLVILWLWYKGKRFGRIYVPKEETARYRDERIKAIAAWYRRGSLYFDSFAMQADHLRFLLQERWSIPYHMKWSTIAPRLEKRNLTMSREDLQYLLTGVSHILIEKKMNKKEY